MREYEFVTNSNFSAHSPITVFLLVSYVELRSNGVLVLTNRLLPELGFLHGVVLCVNHPLIYLDFRRRFAHPPSSLPEHLC